MTLKHRPRFTGFIFTVCLLGLITLAVSEIGTVSLIVMLVVVSTAIGAFYLIFPGNNFFAISLANFLGVYACIFTFFVLTNFRPVSPLAIQFGFTFPVLAFLGGVLWRRPSVGSIVASSHLREERHIGRTFLWLIPVFSIGALTFLVPGHFIGTKAVDTAFLGSMGLIGLIVLFASRDIATFLLDAGLLFEEFFQSAARLLVPAFAFCTFYSLLVIVFGCVYRILDRFAEGPLFLISGVPTRIDFSDALYFSIITLSTVGYGDVIPRGDSIRVIVAMQIVCGVLLLLFGFSEIISYTRRRTTGGTS